MSTRGWLFLATIFPVLGFIAILAWASLNTKGGPIGIGINNGFGKIDIESTLAPEFKISLTTGGDLSLSDLEGKVVLIDFWASWCTPCRQEARILSETYLEYANQPAALGHLEEFETTYPNGIDTEGKIGIEYGVRGVPEKYFVDQNGTLIRKYIGPIQPQVLREIISDLVVN